MNRFATLAAVTLTLAAPATAEEEQEPAPPAPPPPYCENNPEFDQFDFWVGEWDVLTNDEKRQRVGHNSITKLAKDCLVFEHWTDAKGNSGYSMNYFNPITGKWRQVWIDNGYHSDYAGALNEQGQMVLEGTIYYYRSGKSFPYRGVWTPNQDGTVRQYFEQYNPETETWNVWFDGLYVPSQEK